jgi:hypothetical protein
MEPMQLRPDRGAPRPDRCALPVAAAAGALARIPVFRVAPALPAAVSAGRVSGDGWPAAVWILVGYDPGNVFSNPSLDALSG